jgi:hypothetical protein
MPDEQPQAVTPETAPTETAVTPPPPAEPTMKQTEVQRLLADTEARAREVGRREMQAEKDREGAAFVRAQRRLEAQLAAAQQSFSKLDPEAQKELELEQYRHRDVTQAQLDAEDYQQQQAAAQQQTVNATVNQFYYDLTEDAKELGVSPTDKRLNWGSQNEPLTTRNRKFHKSLNAAHKEDLDKQVKDRINAERKALGLESVDNTPNTSATGTRADFLRKFANGDLPLTKTNIDRYNKFQNEE